VSFSFAICKAVRKLSYGPAFISHSIAFNRLSHTELMNDNKLLAAMTAGSDVAKIPNQALYRGLRFVNDCGKKNLLLAGRIQHKFHESFQQLNGSNACTDLP
jgi:hypothetical protein